MKISDLSSKNRTTYRWITFAAAGLLTAALAGCGGGGSSDSTPAGGGAAPAAPVVTAPAGTAPVTFSSLTAAEVAALTPAVSIGGVAISSPPAVSFAISDGATTDNPILGVGTSTLRFALAKLVPGTNGSPSKWVSYGVIDSSGAATRPTTESNGTLVDNGDGTYTYTFANDITKVKDTVAAMTLTGANQVAADLGDLTYAPTLTHRLAIQLSGGGLTNPVNAIYDFIPATGKAVTSADTQRQVVSIDSCNQCHEKLAIHGSARIDTQYCVVCHTDQRRFGRPNVASTANAFPALVEKIVTDSATGYKRYLYSKNTTTTSTSYHPDGTDPTYVADGVATTDFPAMVHKIHMGEELTKQNYNIAGIAANQLVFPDLGNGPKLCAKCHDNTKAAQADNWNAVPSRLACGACHDGIDFAAGTGTGLGTGSATSHGNGLPGPRADDKDCIVCHTAANNKLYHLSVNKTEHNQTTPTGLVNFTYEIKSAAVDATTNALTVVFKISADGTALTTIPPSASVGTFTGSGPGFILAWAQTQDGITTPVDYNNLGESKGEAKSASFASATKSGPDADGYFTYVYSSANAFPVGAKMRAVALQSYWSQTYTNRKGESESVGRHTLSAVKAVTGDTERRKVVAGAKCANCHEFFEGHGGSRTFSKDTDAMVCQFCHVPAKATSGRGISDATFDAYDAAGNFSAADEKKLTEWGFDKTATNKALQFPVTTNNMKDMIHGIHKGRERVTPFMDARDRTPSAITLLDFRRMDFPGKINNCETCHIAGTYTSVPSNTLASTYESINTADAAAILAGTRTTALAKASYATANNDDLVTSPIAGACLSCHGSDSAAAHAASQGGTVMQKRSVFAAITIPAKGEGCFTCHGVGKSEDITVHHK